MSQTPMVAEGALHAHHRHQLAVTEITVVDDDIFVQYLIRPAPREILDSVAFHGTAEDCAAVDDAKNVHRCVVGFRKARNGNRVLGVLQIAGVPTGSGRRLQALFNPLASTPGLTELRCELVLAVNDRAATPVSLRCGKLKTASRRPSAVGGW